MSDAPGYVALGVLGLYVMRFLLFVRRRRPPTEADGVRHRQRGARRWQIAHLPEHREGRLDGDVRALPRALTAPLTGRPCVYYQVVVEQAVLLGWQELHVDRCGAAFALDDPSGTAIINPTRASVAIAFDHRAVIRSSEVTPPQRALLAAQGYRSDSDDLLRFSEAVLSAGDRVTVVGTGKQSPDVVSSAELDYRTAIPARLHLEGSDAAPLSIRSHGPR
jgi:hypothetical protein